MGLVPVTIWRGSRLGQRREDVGSGRQVGRAYIQPDYLLASRLEGSNPGIEGSKELAGNEMQSLSAGFHTGFSASWAACCMAWHRPWGSYRLEWYSPAEKLRGVNH